MTQCARQRRYTATMNTVQEGLWGGRGTDLRKDSAIDFEVLHHARRMVERKRHAHSRNERPAVIEMVVWVASAVNPT